MSEPDFATVATVVQAIPERCIIKGCKSRPTVMVAVADAAGVIGKDSVLIGGCCSNIEHRRTACSALGRTVVEARLKNDYGENATIIGMAMEMPRSKAGPS